MDSRKTTAGVAALILLLGLAVAPLAGCQSLTGSRQSTPSSTRGTESSQYSGKSGQVAPLPGREPAALTEDSEGGSAASKRTDSGTSNETQKTAQQMIVRDKTLTMEVSSVRKVQSAINALATKYGASITKANISSDRTGGVVPMNEEGPTRSRAVDESGPLSGTITIKVPVDKFDAFTTAIRKLGKVQSEAESTEDVTQQHIDMRARLKNLRAEEAAFVRFFRAAKNVREMLSIEQQLSRVRGEIESLQAQIDYLEKRAALATLTVNMSEPGSIVSPSGENWGFVDAIKQAIRNFVGVINFIIMAAGALLPLVVIGAVVFWLVRWVLRRFVFTKTEEQE